MIRESFSFLSFSLFSFLGIVEIRTDWQLVLSETWPCSQPKLDRGGAPRSAGLKWSDVANLSGEDQDNMELHEENMCEERQKNIIIFPRIVCDTVTHMPHGGNMSCCNVYDKNSRRGTESVTRQGRGLLHLV
jgi:hypothetical protein